MMQTTFEIFVSRMYDGGATTVSLKKHPSGSYSTSSYEIQRKVMNFAFTPDKETIFNQLILDKKINISIKGSSVVGVFPIIKDESTAIDEFNKFIVNIHDLMASTPF